MLSRDKLASDCDHRSRVAAERRERTRLRLIEGALPVFAARGVDATIIDEVIAAAGVSRGTFYNYFRSNADLLFAVSEAVSNEVVRVVYAEVAYIADQAERLSSGLRLFLDFVRLYPLFGRFIHRTGLGVLAPSHLAFRYLPRDIGEGVASGRFSIANIEAAVDLVVGGMLMAVFAMDTRHLEPSYSSQVVQHLLMALGMSGEEALGLATVPLPTLVYPADSWLDRVHSRYLEGCENSEPHLSDRP